MFFVTYIRRELARRIRQAVLMAAGLAVGVGLVITVTAASAGVATAQAAALHSLYGIGADITVTTTKPPGDHPSGDGAEDLRADSLLVGDAGLIDATAVSRISGLADVAAAAGGLNLTDLSMPPRQPAAKSQGFRIPTTFKVDGVDPAQPRLGPFASAKLDSGRTFTDADADANVAIISADYAADKLTVGSSITVAKTPFTVIGIVRQAHGEGAADVYLPLRRAQALTSYQNLSNLNGEVNAIYVTAASASAVAEVKSQISRLFPSATVTSSASLASAVTGSLANAASLADNLGRWLAVAVLLAAFALASLLTISAVTRRVREFGTLKALGWPSSRIIAQVIGESAMTGIAGAALGIALGLGGSALINAIAPSLSATMPGSSGADQGATVAVHLTAQVTPTAAALASLLAIGGALIAGALGAWRASRLRPAEALSRLN